MSPEHELEHEHEHENPYAAPQASLATSHSATSDIEQVRRQHLNHEASVKSIGALYLIGGIVILLLGAGILALMAANGAVSATGIGISVFYLLLGVLNVVLAVGLNRLDRRVRLPVGILSGLGLLAVPIGTVINAYILYLIFSSKGTTVFSDEYHEVVRQTPHIKYRTSWLVWGFLIVFLLLLGFALVGALLVG